MNDQYLFFGVFTIVVLYIALTYVWRFIQYRRWVKSADIMMINPRRRVFRDQASRRG